MTRIARNLITLAIALGVAAPTITARAEDWVKKDNPRPFIGVYPVDLDHDRREALDYKGEGVLVEDVVGGGPAEKAGIKAGDIVFKIDKEKIESEQDFRAYIRDHEVGETVNVFVIRDKQEMQFPVELGRRKEDSFTINIPSIQFEYESDRDRGFLGVESMTLDDQLAEYFGVKEGALIQKVVEGSPAEKAGIKAGDVVVNLGGDNVSGSEGLREAIRKHKPEEKVDVKLMRKGTEQVIPVTLGLMPGVSMDSKSHRVIVKHGDDIDVNMQEIEENIREAMEDLDEHLRDGREDLREEMLQLKQEMRDLREQMREQQREREQLKKDEKKTEPKKS